MPRIIQRIPTKKSQTITYLIGALLAFLFVIVLIISIGNNLSSTFSILYQMLLGMKMYSSVFNLVIPLALASLGLAICYKMKFYNIGGEGQIIMGAVSAAAVARLLPTQNHILVIVLMLLAAVLSSGVYSAITGLLKIFFHANEVIITLMFNYIALEFANILQSFYWKSGSFVRVAPLNDNARLTNFNLSNMLVIFLAISFIYNIYNYMKVKKIKIKDIKNFKENKVLYIRRGIPLLIMTIVLILSFIVIPNKVLISSGLLILLLVYLLVDVFLTKTKKGFEIEVIGESIKTARYSGMSVTKTTILVTFISGAILGLTGFVKLAGVNHQFSPTITSGIGFTAVIIAWLSDLKTGRIIIISFIYSFIYQGVKYVETLGVNTSAANIILAIVLFIALTCKFFNKYKFVGGTIEDV